VLRPSCCSGWAIAVEGVLPAVMLLLVGVTELGENGENFATSEVKRNRGFDDGAHYKCYYGVTS